MTLRRRSTRVGVATRAMPSSRLKLLPRLMLRLRLLLLLLTLGVRPLLLLLTPGVSLPELMSGPHPLRVLGRQLQLKVRRLKAALAGKKRRITP